MSIRPEAYSMLPAVVKKTGKKKVQAKTFKKTNVSKPGFMKKGLKFAFRAATSPLALGLTEATVGLRGIRKAGEKITQNRPLKRTMDKRGRFIL
jgi:hypothetical protein